MRTNARWGFGQEFLTHNFTTSGSSQATPAFNAQTQVVRIACNQAVRVAFGSAPTADANDLLIPSGGIEYFVVAPASKVAVLQDSAAGSCTVTEMC